MIVYSFISFTFALMLSLKMGATELELLMLLTVSLCRNKLDYTNISINIVR